MSRHPQFPSLMFRRKMSDVVNCRAAYPFRSAVLVGVGTLLNSRIYGLAESQFPDTSF